MAANRLSCRGPDVWLRWRWPWEEETWTYGPFRPIKPVQNPSSPQAGSSPPPAGTSLWLLPFLGTCLPLSLSLHKAFQAVSRGHAHGKALALCPVSPPGSPREGRGQIRPSLALTCPWGVGLLLLRGKTTNPMKAGTVASSPEAFLAPGT